MRVDLRNYRIVSPVRKKVKYAERFMKLKALKWFKEDYPDDHDVNVFKVDYENQYVIIQSKERQHTFEF